MPRKVKELSDMEIDEISLVDRPANQYASVLIAKRADEEASVSDETGIYNENGEQLTFDDLEPGQIVFDDEGSAYEVEFDDDEGDEGGDVEVLDDEPELVEVGKGAGQVLGQLRQGFKNPTLAAKKTTNPKSTGFAKPFKVGQHFGRNTGKYGLAAGGVGGVGAGVAANEYMQKSFADEVRESLSKALGDAERDDIIAKAMEQVEYLSEDLRTAQEIAKSERDLRLSREYTEVAKSYNVPVDPDELGPVLMRMAEVLPDEDCAVIHKALTAAGEALFEEYGYIGGGDNIDPMSQIDTLIEGQINKSAEGGISKAEAVADFFSANPEAYDEYRAMQRGF